MNIRKQDILLLCLGLLWVLHRAVPLDYAAVYRAGLLLMAYATCRQLKGKQEYLVSLLVCLWGTGESIAAILQSIHCMESHHHAFLATGTFKNPAPLGGLLAFSLLATLTLYNNQSRYAKTFLLGATACIIYGLVQADSRAAYLAVII